MIEGDSSTVSVKFCVALGEMPLLAVISNGYVPPVPDAGVPDRVAVPLPLSVKVTPFGKVPLSESATVPSPLACTVKLPIWPTVKVVEEPEVMVGAWNSKAPASQAWLGTPGRGLAALVGANGAGAGRHLLEGGAGSRDGERLRAGGPVCCQRGGEVDRRAVDNARRGVGRAAETAGVVGLDVVAAVGDGPIAACRVEMELAKLAVLEPFAMAPP